MSDDTHELVACNVRVTPALTRRIRKAAIAEQEGQDARSALMIAAGYDPDEFDNLQTQVGDLTDDANAAEQRLASLKNKAERCAAELSQARNQLSERGKTVENLRKEQTLASGRIAAVEDTLRQSVELRDLPSEIAEAIRAVAHAVRGGGDPKSAFLAAANYDRAAVDDALSSIGRLKKINADFECGVAPLNATLEAGGVKAWIVRRALGLRN